MDSLMALEQDLKVASEILEWEMGDIWGHVGVRVPEKKAIAVKLFRLPDENEEKDWLVHFDYNSKKISGIGAVPNESTIYTEILKVRPDVNAIVHSHAPMCIALSMANKQINTVHMQSKQYAGGVPVYPRPIFIMDEQEGKDLATTLGLAHAVVIRGHGIVTVGRTVREACINALYLERTAKIQAIANALGFQGVDESFLDDLKQSHKKLMRHLGKTETSESYGAEWMYYKRKVLKGEHWNRGWV